MPVVSGFLVFTRPYEYFRKYGNRKDEIALVERLYGSGPVKYKILKITLEEYMEAQGYEKESAKLRLARHVGATKVKSGRRQVGEA